MNRPPLRTKGIYARYRALLSLIVRVRSPGLLPPPARNFLPHTTHGIGSCARCQAPQKTLQRQTSIDRRFECRLEVADPVQQLEQLPYIQDRQRGLQVGDSAHFRLKAFGLKLTANAFREPVLKAAQP